MLPDIGYVPFKNQRLRILITASHTLLYARHRLDLCVIHRRKYFSLRIRMLEDLYAHK